MRQIRRPGGEHRPPRRQQPRVARRHATVGWGARWTGAPPPAGSCPTEITQPNPVHRAHTASGPPPPDAPRLPANRPPRHLRVRAAARPQVWKQQRNGDERPAAPLGEPGETLGGRARRISGTEPATRQEVMHDPADRPGAADRARPGGVAMGPRLPRRPGLEDLSTASALPARREHRCLQAWRGLPSGEVAWC
jgi:hypothetical protein